MSVVEETLFVAGEAACSIGVVIDGGRVWFRDRSARQGSEAGRVRQTKGWRLVCSDMLLRNEDTKKLMCCGTRWASCRKKEETAIM